MSTQAVVSRAEATSLEETVHKIQTLSEEIDGVKEFMSELRQEKRRLKSEKERLEQEVMQFLAMRDLDSIDTPSGIKVSVRESPNRPVVIREGYDVEDVDEEFVRVRTSWNKSRIGDALKEGESLEFAELGDPSKYLSFD